MPNAQEILDTLDAHCYEWFEPIINPIDSHFRVGDTRMSVFRSERHWVIFFELVGYQVRGHEYEVSLYAYGNCLQDKSEEGQSLSQPLYQFSRHPFEFDEVETAVNPATDSWILHRDHFSIYFRGQRLDFSPTAEDYAAAGIVFDSDMDGPNIIEPELLLRFLCHHLDHPFFHSEDYLRSAIASLQAQPQERVYRQTGLSHHLALFLQTREWQHTHVDSQLEYECPSEIPGFHILARAIASGDLTEWNQQDPATFNTDWRLREAERRVERERNHTARQQQAEAFSRLPPELQQEIQQAQQKMMQSGASGKYRDVFE